MLSPRRRGFGESWPERCNSAMKTLWAPWRIDFLGFGHVDLPMPIFFIISLALGALLLHLWQRYGPPGDTAEPE